LCDVIVDEFANIVDLLHYRCISCGGSGVRGTESGGGPGVALPFVWKPGKVEAALAIR